MFQLEDLKIGSMSALRRLKIGKEKKGKKNKRDNTLFLFFLIFHTIDKS